MGDAMSVQPAVTPPPALTAADTHGIALWPANRMFAHSEGLGWHDVYVSLAAERSWSASLDPVKHYCLAYCLNRPARVARDIDGESRPCEAILKPRTFGVVPADRLSHWRLEGMPDILLVYLRRAMVDRLAEELFGLDARQVELEPMLGASDPLLEQLALSLLAAMRARDADSNGIYADSLARMGAVHVLAHHTLRSGRRRPEPAPAAAGMNRVRDYIEAALDSDLSLACLAREAGAGEHSFARRFAGYFGVTPHRYVLDRRLARARRLLIETDLPVADVAVTTGFSSQSHLSAAFRKLTGVSPAAYRRQGSGRA
jgi:AraC family transcriptional regulator